DVGLRLGTAGEALLGLQFQPVLIDRHPDADGDGEQGRAGGEHEEPFPELCEFHAGPPHPVLPQPPLTGGRSATSAPGGIATASPANSLATATAQRATSPPSPRAARASDARRPSPLPAGTRHPPPRRRGRGRARII